MDPWKWPLLTTLLITLIIKMVPKSTSQLVPYYLISACSDTLFEINSQYESNLNTVFESLKKNATANTDGFYSTSAGKDDGVFGVFLCRGDQNTTSCGDCVSSAISDLADLKCPNAVMGTTWYEECMVRYTNVSFIGTMSITPTRQLMNKVNITGDVADFKEVAWKMLEDVSVRASKGGSGMKFATTVVRYTRQYTMYGMAQCTPDLSTTDWYKCLKSSIEVLPVSLGARTLMPSCNIRYEISPFINDDAANFSPPPTPSPTTNASFIPPPAASEKGKVSAVVIIIIVIAVVAMLAILLVLGICLRKKKAKKFDATFGSDEEDFKTVESLQYDLDTIQSSTNYFSDKNKLGEGGFGGVYKGVLEDGKQIAVKRLSKVSNHGVQQFKNEVLVLAKLRHRNLVRLLGFCLGKEEKLLVYEYVANKSLDYFLFDLEKQGHLDWKMRYKIIGGIARGMLYLHEDSDPNIIHRDLKAGNILLDNDLNPKVADFGTARIFSVDEAYANTKMIVGTYGYMAPEYAMHGEFSTKSDVYSFGVLILEIISGRKNIKFCQSNHSGDLLSYAWMLWRDGNAMEFVDPTMRDAWSIKEVMRCMHLGLLCVQEAIDNRPSMSTVVRMLETKSISLGAPQQPGFFININTRGESSSAKATITLGETFMSNSVNDVTVTDIDPR